MKKSTVYLTTSATRDSGGQRPSSVSFDCVTSLSPRFTKTVSSYPVSSGYSITDHVFQNNTQIQLTGIITKSPTIQYENNLVGYSNLNGRDKDAFAVLERLFLTTTTINLVYEYKVFTNLIITSLTPVKDKNAIVFEIGLSQARFASAKRVFVTQGLSSSKTSDASSESPEGSKTKTEVEKLSVWEKASIEAQKHKRGETIEGS